MTGCFWRKGLELSLALHLCADTKQSLSPTVDLSGTVTGWQVGTWRHSTVKGEARMFNCESPQKLERASSQPKEKGDVKRSDMNSREWVLMWGRQNGSWFSQSALQHEWFQLLTVQFGLKLVTSKAEMLWTVSKIRTHGNSQLFQVINWVQLVTFSVSLCVIKTLKESRYLKYLYFVYI